MSLLERSCCCCRCQCCLKCSPSFTSQAEFEQSFWALLPSSVNALLVLLLLVPPLPLSARRVLFNYQSARVEQKNQGGWSEMVVAPCHRWTPFNHMVINVSHKHTGVGSRPPFPFYGGTVFLALLALSPCLSLSLSLVLLRARFNSEEDKPVAYATSFWDDHPTNRKKKNINIRSHPSIRPSCPETVYLARVYCVRPPPRKRGARVTDFFLPRPELGCL